MPTFEYTCTVCNNTVELQLPISERDTKTPSHCALCNTDGSFSRAIGNSGGFRLKGSGWAKDGYSSFLGDTAAYQEGRYNK